MFWAGQKTDIRDKKTLSGTKNDIRDNKRYPGQKTISGTKNDIRDRKRYQGDMSLLCPSVINLIKAQVCDKKNYQAIGSPEMCFVLN